MGGEHNQVLWRGVQPVAGIRGVWPAINSLRVNEAQPQDGVGVKSLKTVPAGKRFFLSGGILSSSLSVDGARFVSLYVRDDADDFVYALMRHVYDIAGQQTTHFVFSPVLEVAEGWEVVFYVEHADLSAYCAIFGWQEDA